MRTKKEKIILSAKILCLLLLVLISIIFVFRDNLLQTGLVKIQNKMAQDYDSQFYIKKASFEGFNTVRMQDIFLVPKNADTLFRIESIKTSINIWRLFTGNVQLESLEAKNGFVQLVKNAKGKNFDAFLPKKKDSLSSDTKTNYADRAYQILNKALNLVPTDMQLQNLSLRMNDMGRIATIKLRKLELIDKQLETAIQVQTSTFNQSWKIKGFADPRNKQADIRFFNSDTGKIRVPYFDQRYNLKASFDSIRLNVSKIDKSGGELHIDGFTSISNFTVNHPKIAQKDVMIKKARFDFNLLFGENFIAVDSSSTMLLNKIKFHPYFSYSNEADKIYRLKIAIPKLPAQDFISSLPKGLFTHFVGMQAQGTFDYKLNFVYNKNKPNALVFESNLNKNNLRIIKYGEANLNKINGEFSYRAIINDVPQRAIFVGQSNPNYTPLEQISPYLRKSVLTTEDPSFFSHHGFINEAFKQSIVKNIRTKKFSRGASTISMQLIKNVFLTREKTISRKLEEILLVYILENNRIVSKERMLEVYFNIIEWGPNVYGIGEASSFYFQKRPSELTLNECLFLANIIPSPRKFMYQFNTEGNLKSFAINRDRQLKSLMMRRGLIKAEDTTYQWPILISGNARSFIKIKEASPIVLDSIPIDEEFDF